MKRELNQGIYADDIAWAQQVVFGYEIMSNTYAAIGEARKDGKPPLYQGKVMNCSACHAQAGTVPDSYPFFRASNFYGIRSEDDPANSAEIGKLYGNLGYKRDIITRTRDCGVHCAGGGEIPEDSDEMAALIRQYS